MVTCQAQKCKKPWRKCGKTPTCVAFSRYLTTTDDVINADIDADASTAEAEALYVCVVECLEEKTGANTGQDQGQPATDDADESGGGNGGTVVVSIVLLLVVALVAGIAAVLYIKKVKEQGEATKQRASFSNPAYSSYGGQQKANPAYAEPGDLSQQQGAAGGYMDVSTNAPATTTGYMDVSPHATSGYTHASTTNASSTQQFGGFEAVDDSEEI